MFGEPGAYVMGKDIILHIAGLHSAESAQYKSVEFSGPAAKSGKNSSSGRYLKNKERRMKNKLMRILKIIGPGIIFASLCIGETHLALLAYSGALYGHAFLWLVVMVHLLYYPNFEYGPRYAVATGETLVDGYAKIKLGRFLLWVFVVLMFVTPPMIMSSLLGLTGSVLYAAFPKISFNIWCILFYLITVGIVLGGRYKLIEQISKFLVLIIVLVSVVAFATELPEPGPFFSGMIPAIPAAAGALVVFVAILRVPTDPASSIFLSEWAQQKRSEWLEGTDGRDAKNSLLTSLKKSIFDIRVGFFLSALVAVIFLSIGATVLRPLGIVPEGIEVSLKLSEIYTQTLGKWIFPAFILMIFSAFWGGYVSAMDGILRLFKNLIPRLFTIEPKKNDIVGIAYILLVTTAGLIMATVVQRPMVMVLLAVSLGLINYPLIFGLNIYCVTKLVDREFRPGKLNLTLAVLGFIVGVGGFLMLVYVRIISKFLN